MRFSWAFGRICHQVHRFEQIRSASGSSGLPPKEKPHRQRVQMSVHFPPRLAGGRVEGKPTMKPKEIGNDANYPALWR